MFIGQVTAFSHCTLNYARAQEDQSQGSLGVPVALESL